AERGCRVARRAGRGALVRARRPDLRRELHRGSVPRRERPACERRDRQHTAAGNGGLAPMKPARVGPTRVYRFYRGGGLIDRLRGEPEQDGESPEGWLGSVVAAHHPGRDEAVGALARPHRGPLLRDEIRRQPQLWGTPNLLVKLLDPVERLPVHAHPDREFAWRELGSDYGKTEAWIVVATRAAQAEVWLGLRESVSREQYREW